MMLLARRYSGAGVALRFRVTNDKEGDLDDIGRDEATMMKLSMKM